MTRRLLAYALLADGLLVALFDGGYVRIWPVRPLIPSPVVSATRRVSKSSVFLTRMIGLAEFGLGLTLLSLFAPRIPKIEAAEKQAQAWKKQARKRAA